MEENKEFKIGDKVYMDSPFGMYRGEVKNVSENEITVASTSPAGGFLLSDYSIKDCVWTKC